jgi:glycosyltransferase involved in cell wall biosynthesis
MHVDFIVETFFPLFNLITRSRIWLITDTATEFAPPVNCERIIVKSQPKNFLLKKIWIERTLAGALKKIKADVFISADSFCSLNLSLPQVVLMPDPDRIKLVHAKKARLLIVTNEFAKKELIRKMKSTEDKIVIVCPPPDVSSLQGVEAPEAIKTKYSDGKEYFLYNGHFRKKENFFDLLKSFSHFKKRQQSNFKLLIIGNQNASWEKHTENYKYRADVIIINSDNSREKAAIVGAAYAVILPFNSDEDNTYALGAMQSGVPVITTKSSSIYEIAGDAVLCADQEVKDIGEKMMLLYKDENMRSQLIAKGRELVKIFTIERAARQFWQSIMKGMN